MRSSATRQAIENGKTRLGIELGSTRIKAVLIGEDFEPIASGSHTWEDKLADGVWTYSLDDVWSGISDCYSKLAREVMDTYGVPLKRVGAVGVSAMMHGYMPFDKDGELLVPFRTWRNTITGEASAKLTELFGYNIPQRWSIAHLANAILDREEHVSKIDHINTLAGYVHEALTGRRVVGVGEASGMFPIDLATGGFDAGMLSKFDALSSGYAFSRRLGELLPEVLTAGDDAGRLTAKGAALLDKSGELEAGIPLCPPEGDAGTGMTATNSVRPRTGNVSAGTSVFAMIVLEKALSKVHPEIDLVTTPSGDLVAMVHCNSCTSDINAWASLFADFAKSAGCDINMDDIYSLLYGKAVEPDADCSGMLSYNCYSGEPVAGLSDGCPLFARLPNAKLTLAGFMRAQLFSSVSSLRLGMDILTEQERVRVDSVTGHGGFFKTPFAGQRVMAAALKTGVTLTKTSDEGGPWGMAVLASYMLDKADGQPLADYLESRVFCNSESSTVQPDARDVREFEAFFAQYRAGLNIEREAASVLGGR